MAKTTKARSRKPRPATPAPAPALEPEDRAPDQPAGPAATETTAPAAAKSWRDPGADFADDDGSIDARMWRTYTKGRRR